MKITALLSFLAASSALPVVSAMKEDEGGVRKLHKKNKCSFSLKNPVYARATDLLAWGDGRRLLEAEDDISLQLKEGGRISKHQGRKLDHGFHEGDDDDDDDENYYDEHILTAWAPLYTIEDEDCFRGYSSGSGSGRKLDHCEPIQVGFVTYDCAPFGYYDSFIGYASCDFNFIGMNFEDGSYGPEVCGTVTGTGIVGPGYPFDDYDDDYYGPFAFGEMAVTGGTKAFNGKTKDGQARLDYLIANIAKFTFEDK